MFRKWKSDKNSSKQSANTSNIVGNGNNTSNGTGNTTSFSSNSASTNTALTATTTPSQNAHTTSNNTNAASTINGNGNTNNNNNNKPSVSHIENALNNEKLNSYDSALDFKIINPSNLNLPYGTGDDKIFGFENFGYTCYCNSVLQCLFFTEPFKTEILSFPPRNKLKPRKRKVHVHGEKPHAFLLSIQQNQNQNQNQNQSQNQNNNNTTNNNQDKPDEKSRRRSIFGLKSITGGSNNSNSDSNNNNNSSGYLNSILGSNENFHGSGTATPSSTISQPHSNSGNNNNASNNEINNTNNSVSSSALSTSAAMTNSLISSDMLEKEIKLNYPSFNNFNNIVYKLNSHRNLSIVGISNETNLTSEQRKRQALISGPILNIDHSYNDTYNMEKSLFTSVKDTFECMTESLTNVGIVSPYSLINVVKLENEMFRSSMHQDAQEFLNFLINNILETVDAYTKKFNLGKSFLHDIYEGLLTSETKCLTCENVSTRDEKFLDLSIDLKQNSSISNCLETFSKSEMLTGSNKFYCEHCHSLQEAAKTIKLKKLPKVLALHLKRFKYNESLNRNIKLFYRVEYPKTLRISNTTEDSIDSDKFYELYAIIVHIGGGPYHGHYVALVKTKNFGWLLFDDEIVEKIDENYVFRFFSDGPGLATAYVLFYQETNEQDYMKQNLFCGLDDEDDYDETSSTPLSNSAPASASTSASSTTNSLTASSSTPIKFGDQFSNNSSRLTAPVVQSKISINNMGTPVSVDSSSASSSSGINLAKTPTKSIDKKTLISNKLKLENMNKNNASNSSFQDGNTNSNTIESKRRTSIIKNEELNSTSNSSRKSSLASIATSKKMTSSETHIDGEPIDPFAGHPPQASNKNTPSSPPPPPPLSSNTPLPTTTPIAINKVSNNNYNNSDTDNINNSGNDRAGSVIYNKKTHLYESMDSGTSSSNHIVTPSPSSKSIGIGSIFNNNDKQNSPSPSTNKKKNLMSSFGFKKK